MFNIKRVMCLCENNFTYKMYHQTKLSKEKKVEEYKN